jgi:predicted RecA/RadA family phage recombinase
MAFEIPGFQRGWTAGGTAGQANSDLSVACTVNSISCPNGYQYMFVKFSGGLLVPIAAATDAAVGVLQNKPVPGQEATVMTSGVTRVRSSSASITVGSKVYIDAFGMVTTTAQANQCVGVAEEVSATAAGYIIAVCLKPFGALI